MLKYIDRPLLSSVPALTQVMAVALSAQRGPLSRSNASNSFVIYSILVYIDDSALAASSCRPYRSAHFSLIRHIGNLLQLDFSYFLLSFFIQGVSGGIVNILGGGSMDYSD